MWDLTVQNDHDFYVLNHPESSDGSTSRAPAPADSASDVLVHNCNMANPQDLNPMYLTLLACLVRNRLNPCKLR